MPSPRKTIALLADGYSSEYAIQVRNAVAREAQRRDVNLLSFAGVRLGAPSPIEATQNRLYDWVSTRRVDGIVLVSSTLGHYCGAPGLEALCRRYAPMPMCSIGLALEGVPSFVVDNAEGMLIGVRHLIEAHGRRRIAFIAGQPDSPESNLRLRGYRRALEEYGIAYDPELVEHGEFTTYTGEAALLRILERGVPFDAVAAANDYMAMAVIDELVRRGLRVPEDVVVLGFDDISAASCTRPSLTTLRQPLWSMGALAVDSVMQQMAGETVPLLQTKSLELVLRESCGCSVHLPATLEPSGPVFDDAERALERRWSHLEQQLPRLVQVPNDVLGAWPVRLLQALREELTGQIGHFNMVFDALLAEAHDEGVNLDEFQRVITEVRGELRRYYPERADELERLWHHARLQVASASVRASGRLRIEAEHAISLLGRSSERFSTTLSLPLLKQALQEELPTQEIDDAAISLFDGTTGKDLRPFLLIRSGREIPVSSAPFDPDLLAPDALFEGDVAQQLIVVALTFECELLGIAVLGVTTVSGVYLALRQQIGAAIKGAYLHRDVIEQIEMRERAERMRFVEEARLAGEIQTSMNPVSPVVDGLEIAALMQPATEAGGDYYDVISDAQGAWLGIGDVTGHGLGAGLVMVMLQSLISSLVRFNPGLLPSQIVSSVNQSLYDVVRNRLGRDDHATLTLIRYQHDGRLTFSGAHEPLIVYRARQRRCELVESPGFWVGAVPAVEHLTQDAQLQLEHGDLLLLYTDGLTEPRNAHREQYGVERLAAAVQNLAHLPVAELRDRLIDAVRKWSSSLDDDVTLVVMRYSAPNGC